MPQTRICIAEITTAHGVRGEVKIRLFTENPNALKDYAPLYLKGKDEPVKIKVLKTTPKHIIARIDGINDRDTAFALRGTEIHAERSALPMQEEEEYYYTDLIGLRVQTPSDQEIGTVITVENFGASDLLEVKLSTSGSCYIPFNNQFVFEVTPEYIVVTEEALDFMS